MLLKNDQILTGPSKPTLSNTLVEIQVELLTKTRPGLGNGRDVRQGADSALDSGNLAMRDDDGGCIDNADLEFNGVSVKEMDSLVVFDR